MLCAAAVFLTCSQHVCGCIGSGKSLYFTLKKSVKIGHNILYNFKDFFCISSLHVFYQYFEIYTSLHCFLELTEMSVQING